MLEAHEGKLHFVTDPICSWCWAMLPEIFEVQRQLGERLEFSLKCAGLQVGPMEPLSNERAEQLIELWHHVADTTNQKFAFALPEDATFIYHSELACRALQISRDILAKEPWEIFHDMQEAFYVNCRNLSDLDVLFELTNATGLSSADFEDLMTAEHIVNRTRDEFDWCHSQGSDALPTLWLELDQEMVLICGGYATADYLVPDIRSRLTTH